MSDVSDLRERLAAAIERAREAHSFFREQCSAEARAYGDAVFAAVDAAHTSLREQKPWAESETTDERISRHREAIKTLSMAQKARSVAVGELALRMSGMPYERGLYRWLTDLANALWLVAESEAVLMPGNRRAMARRLLKRLEK